MTKRSWRKDTTISKLKQSNRHFQFPAIELFIHSRRCSALLCFAFFHFHDILLLVCIFEIDSISSNRAAQLSEHRAEKCMRLLFVVMSRWCLDCFGIFGTHNLLLIVLFEAMCTKRQQWILARQSNFIADDPQNVQNSSGQKDRCSARHQSSPSSRWISMYFLPSILLCFLVLFSVFKIEIETIIFDRC